MRRALSDQWSQVKNPDLKERPMLKRAIALSFAAATAIAVTAIVPTTASAHGHGGGGHHGGHHAGGHHFAGHWAGHGFRHFGHSHFGHLAFRFHGHDRWVGARYWRGHWPYRWVRPAGGIVAGRVDCLTKRYLPNGNVLFEDLCTKEEAATMPNQAR